MNKKYFLLSYVCVFLFAAWSLTGCNDDPESDNTRGSGYNILPNPAEVGQTIGIIGASMKNVTEVVFPNNITVSVIKHIGDFQIDVKIPVGTDEGDIVLKSADGDITVPDFRLLKPEIIEIRSLSGDVQLGPNDVMVIEGKDLQNVTVIIFPGGFVVTSIDFIKKTNDVIHVRVPADMDKEIANIELISISGSFISPIAVDFTGEGTIPELTPLEILAGTTSSKTWTWDERLVAFYGMGDVRNASPAWWAPPVEQFTEGEGLDATLTFNSRMSSIVKNRTDDTKEEGFFTLDMDKKYLGWPLTIGKLFLEGEISILHGVTTCADNADGPCLSPWANGKIITEFEVITLTDDSLVLGVCDMEEGWDPTAEGWGQANYWFFKTVE